MSNDAQYQAPQAPQSPYDPSQYQAPQAPQAPPAAPAPRDQQFPPGFRPDERDRPQVMFVWLWWFIFSPVVLFLAPSYARKAKERGFKDSQGRPQIARYWFPFWLTLVGYAAIAALVITVVVSAHSISSSSSYSSSGSGSTAVATATTPPLDTGHSTVTDNLFPPVIPLANDPQSRQLEALLLADGNSQYESAKDAHCVQDLTKPAEARPDPSGPRNTVPGITSVWNCDISETWNNGRSWENDEYAVVWNGGTQASGVNASDPPGDWELYERTN